LVLSLYKVEVSMPVSDSPTLIDGFDDKVRVGPEREECRKFGRRQIRVGERNSEVVTADVTPTVLNEKIKRLEGGRILESGEKIC